MNRITRLSSAVAVASCLWLLSGAALAELEPGLRLRIYEIGEEMDRLYALKPDQTPNYEKVLPSIDLAEAEQFGGLSQNFRTEVTAVLRVTKAGSYAFRLTADDGAKLTIADRVIVNHDGKHGADPPKEGRVELPAGDHPLTVQHFQAGAGMRLKLEWRRPDEKKYSLLGGDDVLVDPGLTPVVSPGPKKLARDLALSRPGDAWPVEGVHAGWSVTTLHPPDFSPAVSALALGPDGRLLVATFDPPDGKSPLPDPRVTGVVYRVDEAPVGADPSTSKYTRIADQLVDPQGMCFVDGRLFITQREEITELLDRDGDGFYETHTRVAAGWKADNYHHFTFCLVPKDGYLYTGLSTSIVFDRNAAEIGMTDPVYGLLGPNPPNRGSLVRIDR